MDHAEQVAKAVVETIHADSRMEFREDQSRRTHDFDLHLADSLAAVEVTQATDEDRRAMTAAIMDERKGGQFIETDQCENDWLLHPLPKANINLIRERADEYLAAIEETGISRFFGPQDAHRHSSVRRIYEDLSVEAGGVLKWDPPGRIAITTPGGGGIVTAEHLQDAVEREAQKSDNRSKLGTVEASASHLFIYIDAAAFLPWIALIDQDPPDEAPPLPPEIDVVWTVTEAIGSKDQFVVWRGRRGEGWEDLGIISVTD